LDYFKSVFVQQEQGLTYEQLKADNSNLHAQVHEYQEIIKKHSNQIKELEEKIKNYDNLIKLHNQQLGTLKMDYEKQIKENKLLLNQLQDINEKHKRDKEKLLNMLQSRAKQLQHSNRVKSHVYIKQRFNIPFSAYEQFHKLNPSSPSSSTLKRRWQNTWCFH